MKAQLLHTLNKYYILITHNDLNRYSPNQLHSLIAAKKAQIPLQAQTLRIDQELEAMSEANIADLLKKKNKMNDSELSQLQITKIKPEFSFLDHLKSSFIKETPQRPSLYPFMKIREAKKLKGSILNAALAIEVSLEDPESNKIVPVIFLVSTSETESCISKQTLEKLQYNSDQLRREAPINSKVELLVQGEKSIFRIKQSENILGVDFLLNHGVKLICDYSEEVRQFTLAFGSCD